jgi:hypothetical protein
MITKTTVVRLTLFALLMGAVATIPALAGSAVIGSVAGSMNATVGGQSLLPNTTIFSGDSVQVRDGVAVVAVGNNSRVIFGRDTVASFLRDSNEVTVLLSKGSVSLLHPTEGTPVRVKAGLVSVTPAAGFKSLGEVAMLNGSLVISAKEGAMEVSGPGTARSVAKGQTIVVTPKTAADNSKGACCGGGGNTVLEVAAIGAGGVAAILAGVAMSRSGKANTNSLAAISAANSATAAASAAGSSAVSAANAAAAAASAAGSAAVSAANAAGSAATSAANQAAFLAACISDYEVTSNYASAQQMFHGSQCPTYVPYGPGTPGYTPPTP